MSRTRPRAAFRSANMRRCSPGSAVSKHCRTSSPFRRRRYRRQREAAMDGPPFNPDELAAQVLAGGGPRGSGIRDFMPEQHRHFFAQLPYVFLGTVDAAGWPLATLLTGHPGFVQSPDPATLHIAVLPDAGDPAAKALAADRDIGILGIDFSMRRRNRANGHIQSLEPGGIIVAVNQSFGNCPQYIQQRVVASSRVEPAEGVPTPVESFDHLDEAAQAAIERTDTFFVEYPRTTLQTGLGHAPKISKYSPPPAGFARAGSVPLKAL